MIYAGLGQNDKQIGYPLTYLAGILSFQPAGLKEGLDVLARHHHIEITESASECLIISIVNWDKYQSEYQRQKAGRERDSGKVRRNHRQSASEVRTNVHQKCVTEGEVDGEVDGERDREAEVGYSAATVSSVPHAFKVMNCEPYGSRLFQLIWAEEWSLPEASGGTFADSMERAIQRCKSLRIKIPGRFYAHKREIEKVEAENNYKKRNL
jgi:hypothetical protein